MAAGCAPEVSLYRMTSPVYASTYNIFRVISHVCMYGPRNEKEGELSQRGILRFIM